MWTIRIAALCVGLLIFSSPDVVPAPAESHKPRAAQNPAPDQAALQKLAERVAAAQTEEERSALLEAEQHLLKPGLAQALAAQANRLMSQGRRPQALAVYQLAQRIAERIGDKSGLAYALRGLGNFVLQSDPLQGLESYQKSLKLYQELGDKAGTAQMLFNTGEAHFLMGNYSAALEGYHQSLTIREAINDKPGAAATHRQIGILYHTQRSFSVALVYLQRSLELYEAVGNKPAIAGVLEFIGGAHSLLGNFEEALEIQRKGHALRESLGDPQRLPFSLFFMGRASRHVGDFPKSLEYFQQSMKMWEAASDRHWMAYTAYEIGETYKVQGNQAGALEHYQKYLTLRESLGDKAEMVRALYDIGGILVQQGDYPQAQQTAERATVLARETGNNESLWRARALSGEVYRALNQPVQALAAFKDAVSAIETMRMQLAGGEHERIRYLETRLIPWHRLVELLAAQNRVGEALNYTEQAKARGHLDIIHSGHAVLTEEMTGQEREQESRIRTNLYGLNGQILRQIRSPKPDQNVLLGLRARLQTARAEREAFYASLYSTHRQLRALRGKAQTLRVEEAEELLPDRASALLNYLVTEDETFLFVLTRDGRNTRLTVRTYRIGIKSGDLNRQTREFLQLLSKRSPDFPAAARRLYDLLLKPASVQLAGKRMLTISPDAGLWELPFQALQPAPGRYLIEDHALAYAPSLSVLRETMRMRRRKPPEASATLLALGNPSLGQETIARARPTLMDGNLDPLPDAEKQVEALKEIYGPARSKVAVGNEAREELFKTEAARFRILHLATHGILNNSSPIYSQLLLSQSGEGGNEDGLLEAWELLRMRLNADLVVLSACETARGRVGAGEGIVGLTGALMVAGCPTSVVSQWKVESASTTELMVEFHRRLRARMQIRSGGLGTAHALRAAALKLLRGDRYRHPFYWAGFIVVGDGY